MLLGDLDEALFLGEPACGVCEPVSERLGFTLQGCVIRDALQGHSMDRGDCLLVQRGGCRLAVEDFREHAPVLAGSLSDRGECRSHPFPQCVPVLVGVGDSFAKLRAGYLREVDSEVGEAEIIHRSGDFGVVRDRHHGHSGDGCEFDTVQPHADHEVTACECGGDL
ncbi:hypothetical protein BMS3Bbin01_02850 [bacterium BMS3Bbin01]|nr:hypothetical protein BMS3Bbin01_02850 [bacterium BMS3Bbin01]